MHLARYHPWMIEVVKKEKFLVLALRPFCRGGTGGGQYGESVSVSW